MALAHPDFTVARPPGLADAITDAMWWLWLRLHELEPTSELGGILAWKRGFHSTGQYNLDRYPGDYSIRDAPNRAGPWWRNKASALDWTFPEAHGGDYRRIAKYMQRLLASARDQADPRLDLGVFGFFGQADNDGHVEGWNEYREQDQTSDPSHLFHIHFDLLRSMCGDFWAMWALLTVLMGWTVAQWRASLPGAAPAPQPVQEDDDMKPVLFHKKTVSGDTELVTYGLQTDSRFVTATEYPVAQRWASAYGDSREISVTAFDSLAEQYGS